MKKGYWEQIKDISDAQDELEKKCNGARRNAYSFLHGFCDTFAKALHDKYNYDIQIITDKDNNLIHAYCVKDNFYIDIRGIIDDFEIFIQEFELELSDISDLNNDSDYKVRNADFDNLYLLNDTYNDIRLDANQFINNNGFYDLEHVLQEVETSNDDISLD